jgi:2-dehydropantoate 2-reductase
MKAIEKIYLSGLGAIGSSYASRIHEMNSDCLKVILDNDRFERYARDGYYINGKPYSFNYIRPEDSLEPADLIVIAVKQHHLEQSIQDIKRFVGPETIILSLLNGIISEEILAKEFGSDKVLYSFCVGTDSVRQGTNTTFSNIGKIVFGEKINEVCSPRVEAVKELLEKSNIPYNIPKDMFRELWWKFMVNVGINQISAVLKAPYGVFQRVKEAEELMITASNEVVQLSRKVGINLKDDDIQEFIRVLSKLAPEGKTSMLQDVEAKRKTEVDIFAGTVIELGKKYGVATPVNDLLYKMIRTLEQM